MALDWDNIEIIAEDENIVQLTDWNAVEIISEENEIIKLSDSNIINVDAMDRMIIFGGERGERGEQGEAGPQGPAGKVRIGTTTTLPAGSAATVVNRGTDEDAVLDFGIPKGVDGDNAPTWGNITGTLSDQSDLQNALNAKANTADLGDLAYQDSVDYAAEVTNKPPLGDLSSLDSIDYTSAYLTNKPTLGTMAAINDAPSDGKEYARKNGAWSEVTGGVGSVDWGDIGGTLSDQTDLKNALDAKANTADLGDLASKDSVDYLTEVTNKPTLGTLAGKNSVDYSTNEITNKPTLGALAAKSSVDYSTSEVTNKPTLGTMAAVNDASSDSKLYGRKNGAWSEVPTPSAPEWGDIGGTLADQTDLANALAAKANTADLGDLASKDSVNWNTDIDNIPSTFPPSAHIHDDRYYTESETNALLADKADTADLGDLAYEDSIDYSDVQNTPTLGALASKDTVDWDTDIDDIPSAFPPEAHTHDDRYYTESEVDTALSGKVNKSGDTMTGDLIVKHSGETSVITVNSDLTLGTPPANNTWVGGLAIQDPNGGYFAYIESRYGPTDSILYFRARNKNGNTNYDNGFQLVSKNNGTKEVAFADTASKNAWKNALDLADSGWIAFAKGSNTYNGTIYYRKAGDIVYIRSDGLSGLTGSITIGYVRDDCKPDSDLYFPIFCGYPAYTIKMYTRVYAKPSGAVQLTLMSGETITAGTAVGIMVSYIV